MAVNSLFKKLKVNFDEIKDMIANVVDLNSTKSEYLQMQKKIQEREIKMVMQEYRMKQKSIHHQILVEYITHLFLVVHFQISFH